MGRVVAIANQKGGVGKTTTAINLSASLAACEKRTLLIDLDPQANATSGLGAASDSLGNHIYNVLLGERKLGEAVLETDLPDLRLVPSTKDLIGAEIELVSSENRERRLLAALDGVRESYDYVVFDCPPSLGLLTVNALTAADSILIPLQCEYYPMEGLASLFHTVELIREKLNPDLEVEGILLTMYDIRNNLSHQVAQEVRSVMGDRVFRTIIPRNVRLSEAPSYGKPVLLYDMNSRGAFSYLEAARELVERGERRGHA